MSGLSYPIPIYLPRRKRIISPAEWLRDKLAEREADIVMATAFDSASESHTGTTGAASVASFTWNHTPVGTPRGVVVFCFAQPLAADIFTGVTYGGVALTAVSGGFASDTDTEPGCVKAYFYGGAGIPTGLAAVVVNRTNNATITYAVVFVVVGSTTTEVPATVQLDTGSGVKTPREANVDDLSPGTDSVRFAAMYSGHSAIQAAGANSTTPAGLGIDFGALVCSVARETTAGQGSRPVGFTTAGGNDDVATVFLAVRETPVPPDPLRNVRQARMPRSWGN